jgi:hypothetical protein
MAIIPQQNDLLQKLEHSFEAFTLKFDVWFHLVSEFFPNKSRGRAANWSWICCSVPSNVLAFDQQTFCLNQLNNKKSQAPISGLCGSNVPGSGPLNHAPGTLLANDDWNVKTYFEAVASHKQNDTLVRLFYHLMVIYANIYLLLNPYFCLYSPVSTCNILFHFCYTFCKDKFCIR